MKLANLIVVAVSVMPFLPLRAAESGEKQLIIRLSSDISDAEKKTIQKELRVSDSKTIPQFNAVRWVIPSTVSAASVNATLAAHPKVLTHDLSTTDYRKLFVDVTADGTQTGDISPDIANAAEKAKEMQYGQEVRLVRVRAEDISVGMLTEGFGITDGFTKVGSVSLNLSPTLTATAVRKVIERDAKTKKISSWTADIFASSTSGTTAPKDPIGTAIFSVNGRNILGRVTVARDTYVIQPIGNGYHAIVKVNPEKLPPDHPPSHKNQSGGDATKLLKPTTHSMRTLAGTGKQDQMPNPPVSIKVGIGYSKSAASIVAGGDIEQFSDALILSANDSYKNSQISNLSLVKVGTKIFDYVEKDFDIDLERLIDPNDGVLDDVHPWRRKIKANLIVIVTTVGGACGNSAAILAEKDTAFALVNSGCSLTNLSFTHEVGHLQGARHDPDADATLKPFPYGHGYAVKENWRTVMAYPGNCNCPRLPYWANPRVKKEGIAMGTTQFSDDSRVLGETATYVSGLLP